jgi:hypothetical protein
MQTVRRNRWYLLGIAALLVGLYCIVDFFFIEDAKRYFDTECYLNTVIAPMSGQEGPWGYREKQGPCVVSLRRGRPASTVTTAHGWWEALSIELSARPTRGKVDLQTADVRAGFTSYFGRATWVIGEDGVSGYLLVTAVDAQGFEADYDLTVDAFRPGNRHRKVSYKGRARFRFSSRPDPDTMASEECPFQPGRKGSNTYCGVLKHVYLPKDEKCHAISAQGKLIVLRGKYDHIDEGLIGKEISVTGVLEERRLPMFILDERKLRKNEMVPQGIPMPPGTDIDKESLYYVVVDPEWRRKE